MASRILKTTDISIKGQIANITLEQAICEYIWNGYDANAKCVQIKTVVNEMNGVNSIEIIDDGDGIDFNELESTFDLFLDSKKKKISNPTIRGRKGKGRFTFVKFCDRARWSTNCNGKSFDFEIVSSDLNKYEPKNILPSDLSSGTTVTFDIIKDIDFNYFNDVIIPYIRNEFSWLLESGPALKLIVNGVGLNKASNLKTLYQEEIEDNKFDLHSIIWNEKPNKEKSYVYFINSDHEIVHKELSNLNHKGFFCSCYVNSNWFDSFKPEPDLLNEGASPASEVFIEILSFAKQKLRQRYIEYRNSAADHLIQQYMDEGIFPEMSGNNKLLNEFHRDQLINTIKTIYEAEPAIFSKGLNKTQKKVLVKLLDRIIQTNRLSELFDILDGIVSLSEDDISKISTVLQRTSLQNIAKTIEHVRDRLDIVNNFRSLIYDHKKYALEVPHIQKCIEENLWIFGEQYYLLTSEEDKFDHALREFLKFHKKDDLYDKAKIHHPDKNKEMDIFAAQKGFRVGDDGKKYFHHVVLELKRPSIKLKDEELTQIKRYKNLIANEPKFFDEQAVWDFILVGNEISDSNITAADLKSDLETNKIHGEPGLVQKTGNIRIFVKTWKQILNDFELRYNDISNKLNLKEAEIVGVTPEELTENIKKVSASAT